MNSIAIDGPAGAGKSTVAKEVAKRLGYIYLDTGAMYRTVAYKAIKTGISCNDVESIITMLDGTQIGIEYEDGAQRVILDGRDVTGYIRTDEVSRGASDVAVIPKVRLKLVELQRDIARENDVVMDGRDIGTFVLPDARVKVFLTASVSERARRRYAEMKEKGGGKTLVEIEKEIEYRDKNDSAREFAPLRQAEDAVLIDTTELTVKQVIEEIINLAKK